MFRCECVYVCVCVYIYIYIYYIHTYIHTHIHTHTHIYRHTQQQAHTHMHKYIHTYIHSHTHTQNPYDLLGSNRMMHVGVGPVYDRVLCKGLIRTFAAHRTVLARRKDLPSWERVAASNTVMEFDDRHTRRAFGYASVEDYYHDGSSKNTANNIAVPLLFLIAEDDQLLDVAGMDLTTLVKSNPNVIAAVTKRGGHVAWHERLDARREQWADRVIVEFFSSLLAHEMGLP